jgi:hypothetical protein
VKSFSIEMLRILLSMTLLYLHIASVLEMVDDKKFKIDVSGIHATFSLKKVNA